MRRLNGELVNMPPCLTLGAFRGRCMQCNAIAGYFSALAENRKDKQKDSRNGERRGYQGVRRLGFITKGLKGKQECFRWNDRFKLDCKIN